MLPLIRLTQPAVGGSSSAVGYGYDARGNRTRLTYPDGKTVVYGYDTADRITSVSPDWDTGSYSYQYLNHRLITMTNPAGVVTTYNYDTANRLTGIKHQPPTPNPQPLATYNYALDSTGNVRTVTETQSLVLPAGTYQESGGQVVMESENGQRVSGTTHQWLTATVQSGYTGTAYLQTSLDVDQLYQTNQITSSPRTEYSIQLTTPGTYTLWLRGYPNNAAGDSVYVGLKNQVVGVTGFAPGQWTWAKLNLSNGLAATLPLTKTGLITMGLWMREDGLQIDRLLLTTSTTFIPTGFGPTESSRIATQTTLSTTITRTIVYTYDDLYRLTNANYSTGELFAYTYDPAGNRKTQTTLAGTNVYTYDAANRLTQVDGQSYSWDNNGNLLNDGIRSYGYDAANRLTSVIQGGTTTQFMYNGDGDRMVQIVNGLTTSYALDPTGLAQVLVARTSGQSQYYLPGLAQYDTAWAYYLPDRLGNLRQMTNNTGQVNLAQSYDPFGSVLEQIGNGQSIFGYTGEQIDPTGLVYLRARYYNPYLNRFISPDTIIPNPTQSQSWNRYLYGYNNPIKFVDPSGYQGECIDGQNDDSILCRIWENRGDINRNLSVVTLALDYGQNVVSFGGIGVEITAGLLGGTVVELADPFLPPPFEGISAAVATGVKTYNDAQIDNAETTLSLLGFLTTASGDIFGEKTYIDATCNELVIGQDTIVSAGSLYLSGKAPEAVLDHLINYATLTYDYNRFHGNIPDYFELRVGGSLGMRINYLTPLGPYNYPTLEEPYTGPFRR